MFVVRRAMFKFVCLKRLVTFLVKRLWYVKGTHFVVVGLLRFVLIRCFFLFVFNQFFFLILYDLNGESIALGYSKYDFPLLLFG